MDTVEQPDRVTDGPPGEVPDEQLREIVGYHVSFVRDLNDELLRTIRIHALIIGIMATGFSVAGFDVLLSTDRPAYLGIPTPLFWLLGGAFLAVGVTIWMGAFFNYERQPYSNLQLGKGPEKIDVLSASGYDCIKDNVQLLEQREEYVAKTQQFLMLGVGLLVVGLLLLSM